MRTPREPRRSRRGLVIGVIVLLLIGGAATRWASRPAEATATTATRRRRPRPTGRPRRRCRRRRRRRPRRPSSSSTKKRPRRRRSCGCRSSASGTVYVCLVDRDGAQRINGVTLNDGQTARAVPVAVVPVAARQRQRAVRVDGKTRTRAAEVAGGVPDQQGVGRRRRSRQVGRAAAHERPRRHRRHGHRGPDGPRRRTATGRGWPSGCASWASTSRTSSIVGDRPEDIRDALGWLARRGDGPDRHQRRAGADRGRPDGAGRRGLPGAGDGA